MDGVDPQHPPERGRSPVSGRRLRPEAGAAAQASALIAEPRSFAPRSGGAAIIDLRPRVRPSLEADGENRVLVVIPCLNEEAFIGPLLEQLLSDEALEEPLIVVADGGSTDRTRAIVAAIAARDSRVRLLANPGRLQSAGVNLAARVYGQGRAWLVRVDAHAVYPENYVSRLLAEGRRTAASSVVVSMETRGEGGFQRAVAVAQNSRLGTGGSAHRSRARAAWVDHGHHALFRLTEFLKAGGYDESFSHNEDAEFDLRLGRGGGRIWLTDALSLVYHPRSTPGALWRQYVNYGRGRARTVLKHRTRLKPRQALPLAVAPAVAAAAAAPLFWPAALPALAWAGLCLGYGAFLGAKARDGWAMLSGAAAMEMHLAWSLGFWSQLIGRGRKAGRLPAARAPAEEPAP